MIFLIILIILIMVIVTLVSLLSPFTLHRVKPGMNYKVADKARTIPYLEITGKNVYLLKKRVLNKMNRLLKLVHQELERNNIPYWITCGTLLGCIRHGGFIPWDDDIDINVELQHRERLLALLSGLEARGYSLCNARGGYKFGYNNFPVYPYIDIVMVNNRNGALDLCYPLDGNRECTYEVGNQWPDECFPEKDVYPLSIRKFEDFAVYTPCNSEKLLKNIYGDDCLLAAGSRQNEPYAYSLKSFPWFFNHFYDNILFRLGFHKG